jgi:lipoic acid synthetase
MRLPDWIRTRGGTKTMETRHLIRRYGLSTVCDEARCPNRPSCFSKPTATFMILGSRCTRDCGFCSVSSGGPEVLNENEPANVAAAADEMGLRYVVITSVTRDDLPDGGAGHFAKTIRAVKERRPTAGVEVLTPDFQGDLTALKTVIDAGPDVFNHNIETVPRLYPSVRPQADYGRSLRVLRKAREMRKGLPTKSGFMLGLGEQYAEVIDLLADLRETGCDFLTIGQYLQPTRKNLPVVEYVSPEVFDELREQALRMGFQQVSSGPLVRSSMNAEEMYGHV